MRKSEVVRIIFLLGLMLLGSGALANENQIRISFSEKKEDGTLIDIKLTLVDKYKKVLGIKKDKARVINNQAIYEFTTNELIKEFGFERNQVKQIKTALRYCAGCEEGF